MQHSQGAVQVLVLVGLVERAVVEGVDVLDGALELLLELGQRGSALRQLLEGALGLRGGEELGLGSRLFTSTRELHSILNISRRRGKYNQQHGQLRRYGGGRARKAAAFGCAWLCLPSGQRRASLGGRDGSLDYR